MSKTILAATAALILAARPATAQRDDFSKIEVKPTQVAGNVWVLIGAGGNIGVSAGADGVSVWFNGEEIQIVHVPHGHTDGDSVVFFKGANVVHMGDQFFNGMFPFIDRDSGGDVRGYVKNVADMIARVSPGAKIIPGHGAVGTIDDLKKCHAMLVRTSDIVEDELAKGMTLDEAKKVGLPEEFKPWAGEFITTERWIETLYTALK